MNKNIIGKINSILLAALMLAMVSCSSDIDDTVAPRSQSLKYNISDAGMMATGVSTRASIDNSTMTTKFEVGDEAGVFGVKDGKIVDGLNNLKLKYNVNGFWDATAAVSYDASLDGVKFYGYYPYDQDATFDASAQDPFSDYVSTLTPSTDQSTNTKFNDNDIMTSEAATIDAQFHSVTLNMSHRLSLINVELPNSSYIFTNAEPYVMSKAENASFSIGGEVVNPYFDSNTQSYRLLVKPNSDKELKVSFTDNGKQCNVEINNTNTIGAGQYANYVIDGGASLTNMTLQVGDYFLSDGNIVSKDSTLTEEQKAKVIGIVYQLGTTEAIKTANANWNHAMVIGTTTSKGKWGDKKGSTTSAENNAGWRNWYNSYGITDLGTPSADKVDLTTLTPNGYEETNAWRNIPSDLTIGGYTIDVVSGFHAADEAQATEHPTPGASTKWFIPSIYEWIQISSAAEAVNASLASCGGTALGLPMAKPGYHSSSIRGAAATWTYLGKGSSASTLINANGCATAATYRWILAF